MHVSAKKSQKNSTSKQTILEEKSKNLTHNKNLKKVIPEIKFLAVSLLDDFEKSQFKGKTIMEVLQPTFYE